MSKPTPTPWMIDPANPEMVMYSDGYICDCDAPSYRQTLLQVEWEANAAFIVQAVNAHQDLVEALEQVLIDWDDGSGAFTLTQATINKAQAALKKAKGV